MQPLTSNSLKFKFKKRAETSQVLQITFQIFNRQERIFGYGFMRSKPSRLVLTTKMRVMIWL